MIFVFGSNLAGRHGAGAALVALQQHGAIYGKGQGLAGFKHEKIAPMFENAPGNCFFDTAWKPWLGDAKNYWGTF